MKWINFGIGFLTGGLLGFTIGFMITGFMFSKHNKDFKMYKFLIQCISDWPLPKMMLWLSATGVGIFGMSLWLHQLGQAYIGLCWIFVCLVHARNWNISSQIEDSHTELREMSAKLRRHYEVVLHPQRKTDD
jgi:hypothetical protein